MIFRADVCFALFLDIYCPVAKHFHTAMCCFYKDQGLRRLLATRAILKTGQMNVLLSPVGRCRMARKKPFVV
jgi:protein-disulfide isomerase